MTSRFQIVTAGLMGAALLALAPAAPESARAGDMKGLHAPSDGTTGAHRFGGRKGAHGFREGHQGTRHESGARVFGKKGTEGAGKFVRPEGESGHGGKHRRKFHGHGFPVIVYPLGGSYAVATGGDDADDEAEADAGYENAAADDDVFAITNSTDEEMTVYDNGRPVCVLAPGVRCSFDISKGRHDISIGLGADEARRALPRASGPGKMIVVWEALEKLE